MCHEALLEQTVNNFVHLHCHTAKGSKDSFSTSGEHASHAKAIGQTHLALTDHGSMSAAVEHKIACDENNIVPIFGVEGYITIDDVNNPSGKVKANHITLLAKNKIGYENLVELNNSAHRNIFQKGAIKFPLMTYKRMQRYREGLIVLTGCPASLTHHQSYDVAAQYVETLIRIFGEENTFAELMFVMDGHDFHTRPLELAAEFGIETVITGDTHFTYKGDEDLHMICTHIRSRAATGTDYSYDSKELWLKSGQEMYDRASRFVEPDVVIRSFDNIKTITDQVKPFELQKEPQLPHVSDEELDKFKKLIYDAHKEYKKNNRDLAEEADARLAEEFEIIDMFDYWSYFYIVNDIAYFCRKHERFNTARGSAGGSYVIYLLGIFTVDPIRYKLLFARFLNTARKDFPDIDLDIDSTFRDAVLEYCKTRWQLEKVSTVMSAAHRTLINALSKELKIPYDDQQELLKCEAGDEEYIVRYMQENPLFDRAYNAILDKPFAIGSHASAVCSILDETKLPIEGWGKELSIAFSGSGNNYELPYVGGVKFDILGSTTLATLYHMYKLTGVLPPSDPAVEFPYEVFASGNTLGIMQFDGSAGIRDLCRSIKPKDINELATINSMYRPGALLAGTAQNYINYKKKPRKFHPLIDKVLEDTYSVIVYQEQVMELYRVVTGGNMEEADLARRVISVKSPKKRSDPKWIEEFAQVKENFLQGGIEQNIPGKVVNTIWEEIEHHSKYSFNKSHSIGYADIARMQAWYKVNYPIEFYFATLTALQLEDKTSRMQDFIWGISEEGYTINPPNILHSSENFELVGKDLYMPLTTVKQVTLRTLEAINYLKEYMKGECTLNKEESLNGILYYDAVDERLEKLKAKEQLGNNAVTLKALSKGFVLNKSAKDNLARVGGFKGVEGDLSILYSSNIFFRNKTVLALHEMLQFLRVWDDENPVYKNKENGKEYYALLAEKLQLIKELGIDTNRHTAVTLMQASADMPFYDIVADAVCERLRIKHDVCEVLALPYLFTTEFWTEYGEEKRFNIEIEFPNSLFYSSKAELQTHAMAMLLPDEWYHRVKADADAKRNLFGIVLKREAKLNSAGKPIVVYHCTDNKSFRVYAEKEQYLAPDGAEKIPVGTPIVAKISEWGYVRYERGSKTKFELIYAYKG